VAATSDDPAVGCRLGSVGRPLPTLEVEIRDADGSPLGPGQPGEVWVRGEQVAGEYLDRAGGTEAGWFPTRDSGFLDPDGYLFLCGRLDDVIVRGGENLSHGEIEDVLLAHPAVAEAAVAGVPDREWGEAVAAAVVLSDGSAATQAELQDRNPSRFCCFCRFRGDVVKLWRPHVGIRRKVAVISRSRQSCAAVCNHSPP
jgi:acyl-CoA synthetase (AMP-forming)/AMP-acid ligase II